MQRLLWRTGKAKGETGGFWGGEGKIGMKQLYVGMWFLGMVCLRALLVVLSASAMLVKPSEPVNRLVGEPASLLAK